MPEENEERNEFVCSRPGCGRAFPSKHSLSMHMAHGHGKRKRKYAASRRKKVRRRRTMPDMEPQVPMNPMAQGIRMAQAILTALGTTIEFESRRGQ